MVRDPVAAPGGAGPGGPPGGGNRGGGGNMADLLERLPIISINDLKVGDTITVFGWRARDGGSWAHSREITLPERSQYYTPSWSPDGKEIFYIENGRIGVQRRQAAHRPVQCGSDARLRIDRRFVGQGAGGEIAGGQSERAEAFLALCRKAGFDARYMAGGHSTWKAIKGPVKLHDGPKGLEAA